MVKNIALLATGDELVNGDILNTNAQYFAKMCSENGLAPGQQIVVGDCRHEIEQSATYLLAHHQALITIGGLGPTSDDQTRYGLTEALGLPLIFYPEAWEWIVARFEAKGYTLPIPENNRQQALFPQGSHVLQNHHGSAAACYINYGDHDIFMLPGPPSECRLIFNNHVIPKLTARGYQQTIHRHAWLLQNTSEGHLASQLDPLIPQLTGCRLGYRLDYPYLEIKLRADTAEALAAASLIITPFFKNNIVKEECKKS